MKTLAFITLGIISSLLWWQLQNHNQAEQRIPIPLITIEILGVSITTPSFQASAETQTDTSTQVQTETILSSSNSDGSDTIERVEESSEISDEVTTSTPTANCSSADTAGLISAFDRELGVFLNNAAATYGSQYSNLQYDISNQSITQNENQGTVSANYQGSVSEIATGETIRASGGMTVNFSWDGCQWILVDYSYF